MCGLVAMYSQRGPVVRERLERATRSLHHRGPDAQRLWFDAARGVGLGHARLSIIDLEGGEQPVRNEDESVQAVVNGELYDFERQRADLLARGHDFRTGSDSEVLVHLYEEYGASCVEQLRGEVAFVLFDAKNDLLLAGRDRFGIKPLVYALHDGVLMLASEAKALFAAGLPARWDHESFLLGSVLGGPLEDRTFFEGVFQLAPGHVLVATRQSTRLVRYWDFAYPARGAVHTGSEADDTEALRATLEQAVRLRLRADVPVACYLSGGLDSCAILGLAAQHAQGPIRAFTLAFDHAAYKEAPIAEEMAARVGAQFTPIPVGEADFARDFAEALWHAERPLNNANSVAKFRLSRAVRDAGLKVVLTGEGADEIFAGYPHYRRDALLAATSGDAEATRRAVSSLEQSNAVSRGILLPEGAGTSVASVQAALGFVPTWLEAFATTGQKMRGLLSSEFLSPFGARDPLALFVASLETRQLRGRHPVHQAMYAWSKSVLPNFILSALGDRMEMAHSIEGRVPFLDHHVVELASALPMDRLIRGSVEKYLLREAARPVLTDTVYRRQKHPFFAPPTSDTARGPLLELLHDTLRGPALRALPFFNAARVTAVLDALPSLDEATRVAIDAPLLVILSTALMHQRFAMSA